MSQKISQNISPKFSTAFYLVAFALAGCASVKYQAPLTEGVKPSVTRHLAWMEGDLENGFEPNRTVAEAHAQAWEGKVPEMSDSEAYLEYVTTIDAAGHGAVAEKKLREYLAKHPKDKKAIFVLAGHYLRAGKKELATYLYHQLEKDSEFAWKSPLFNNLGLLALKEKNRLAALEYLEKATRAEPASPAPFVNLGSIYLQSHSWADAEKLFARARELDSSFEDASLGLGLALEGLGKLEEAHAVYSEHLGQNSEASSVLFNDAALLGNRLKRRDEAAELMKRYLQHGGKETAKAHEFLQNWR